MSKVFTITEGLENLGALRTGGQGSVYKGKRTGIIYTAVKLIPTPVYKENQDDKNYINFKNEVAKLLKVNENPSPNVVKMLSSGITESGSFPFIEMEYIDGPDLGELLQAPHEKIFTLKELFKVAEQLASAIAHCHKVGVKHGDIKSNNVKYNVQTGNYILLDFGLAIMTDEQRRSSIRHAGAVEFMAPEQNDGKMLLQSDVYSYGIILYELLGGQVPFPLSGNSDTGRNTVMIGHLENEVPDVIELRKANLPENWTKEQKEKEMQVPDWLLAVIQKCLQKDPKLRFDNGMQLHDAIMTGRLLGAPVQTTNHAINELENRTGIRLSTFTFTCLMIVLVGLVGFIGYSELTKKEPIQSTINPVDSVQPSIDSSELEKKEAARRRAILTREWIQRTIDSTVAEEKKMLEKNRDTTQDTIPDTSAGSQ